MSDNPVSASDPQVVGQTSDESTADSGQKRKTVWQRLCSLSIYDYMLLVSLVLIVLSVIMLIISIRSNFPGLALPWRTDTGTI